MAAADMHHHDTIVALSSGSVPSGVAVIRLSGPKAGEVLTGLAGSLPSPRHLALRQITGHDSREIDEALVAWFPAPSSFTGEDCVEIQCHGSAAVVSAILREISRLPDCRLADAGEFSRRAFENGKLDLTQVEGLGDLIAAQTETQRQQALGRMRGRLSELLTDWRVQIIDLRAEVEARLDFSDEGDVADALPHDFVQNLDALAGELKSAIRDVAVGRIVRDGFRVTLAGAPNAGKSTLMNALAQSDVAIVTEIAGTTRDVLEVPLDIGGQLVLLADTAGLRDTPDVVEAEGVRRAQRRMAESDLVIVLVPGGHPVPEIKADCPVWIVRSKSDRSDQPVSGECLAISAKTGFGMKALMAELQSLVTRQASAAAKGEAVLVSRERDRVLLSECLQHLNRARDFHEVNELLAEELRLAGDAIGRMTGVIDAEHVLDRLFAGFCIGK
ncbi:tRNA uridine-5-carboxymethylaminomethyl(34) synthesis GTPase MnmE [Cucumibacter marinus]|uniref:tRNA uridine-5-carboxymethylaminomethyl(34) synthesis GTPase MnmE n=1 Tax=Cucumibacter marinus TaxID=1121252 RepID=UPI00041A7FC8|nr:tRNA uridine-5-carboxymethylaminomethyl(34) synthesis GTPase MnmE [Cucumibacter marinus]